MSFIANLDAAFFITWLAAGVQFAGPVLLASLGEILGERAGVLNIGMEGTVLLGALGSYLVAFYTGMTWLGFFAGGLTGLLAGCLLAFFYVTLGVSQVVVGIIFNVFAAALASYVYMLVIGNTGSATIAMLNPVDVPYLSHIPVLGQVLFQQPWPLYLTVGLMVVAQIVLFRTKFGLSLRAAGENPHAAYAAGINVLRIRTLGVLLSCCGAGLSGGYLVAAEIGLFRDDIVSGQGFIALAIVIFGRWHPLKAALAALVFGLAYALQLSLQLYEDTIPAQALLVLPYLLTILAMSGVVGKAAQPVSLSMAYRKE